eukprot:CAMPEP_0181381010 /NCGR_PEP_ID=MMETSP1106-20121128/19878_1 /TAXON_ID=81844 /ORGANISM="Mantoniella antarctica, Strain SL-175" /LENGTH=69 /DNA_ID=CAMNT_0023500135 /DNA_START=26 /DNA_END=232 /DNA_ORIENTATION=+
MTASPPPHMPSRGACSDRNSTSRESELASKAGSSSPCVVRQGKALPPRIPVPATFEWGAGQITRAQVNR